MRPNPARGEELVLGKIAAFKAAKIVLGDGGGLLLKGIGYGGVYGTHDVASCETDRAHVPPHPGCSCGFYAWRHRENAVELLHDVSAVIIAVELWGSFHEYDLGFVAAAQQVRQVTLQPFCAGCLANRGKQFIRATALAGDQGPPSLLRPMCNEHADREQQVFRLFEVAEMLQVPVTWAEDDDAVTEAARRLASEPPILQRRVVRRLDDLLPGEIAHVFQNSLALDDGGTLHVNVLARLIQPLPGTDVPIRLGDDGVHEVLLDDLRDFCGWQTRRDWATVALPVRIIGTPGRRTVDPTPVAEIA